MEACQVTDVEITTDRRNSADDCSLFHIHQSGLETFCGRADTILRASLSYTVPWRHALLQLLVHADHSAARQSQQYHSVAGSESAYVEDVATD